MSGGLGNAGYDTFSGNYAHWTFQSQAWHLAEGSAQAGVPPPSLPDSESRDCLWEGELDRSLEGLGKPKESKRLPQKRSKKCSDNFPKPDQILGEEGPKRIKSIKNDREGPRISLENDKCQQMKSYGFSGVVIKIG